MYFISFPNFLTLPTRKNLEETKVYSRRHDVVVTVHVLRSYQKQNVNNLKGYLQTLGYLTSFLRGYQLSFNYCCVINCSITFSSFLSLYSTTSCGFQNDNRSSFFRIFSCVQMTLRTRSSSWSSNRCQICHYCS